MHDILPEVETRLRATGRFELLVVAGGELVVGRPDTRMKVLVRVQRSGDAVALVMHAPICYEHAVPARVVLEAAAQMGAGAIALVEQAYVVRYSIPAAGVANAPLAQLVNYLGDLAAELAVTFASRRSAHVAGVFSHAL